MAIELTQTASARGTGELTGDDLAEFARAIPGHAKVDVVTKKAQDQRDNDSWSLTASWKGEAKPKLQLRRSGDVLPTPSEGSQFWGTGHP